MNETCGPRRASSLSCSRSPPDFAPCRGRSRLSAIFATQPSSAFASRSMPPSRRTTPKRSAAVRHGSTTRQETTRQEDTPSRSGSGPRGRMALHAACRPSAIRVGRPWRGWPRRPPTPAALQRTTRSRSVCRSSPAAGAAAPRPRPSSTLASAISRAARSAAPKHARPALGAPADAAPPPPCPPGSPPPRPSCAFRQGRKAPHHAATGHAPRG